MAHKDLKNKPLVETLLELKWALQPTPEGIRVDPHYKILVGRLYDRVMSEYPEHEQLSTASMPDEIVPHTVQHRFRKGPEDWPLIQVGPGILAVNETSKYTWSDFMPRCLQAVEKLFEAYPKGKELKVESLVLRYIDAVEFDFMSANVFDFLKDKMKVGISLPENLFAPGIQNHPRQFSWQSSFACDKPKGVVTLRFSVGRKDENPALFWETVVQSTDADVPAMPGGFKDWIESAHAITDQWFFALIAGELERKFSGE